MDIAKLGIAVNPDPKTIERIQDKFLQKEMLKHAEYRRRAVCRH